VNQCQRIGNVGFVEGWTFCSKAHLTFAVIEQVISTTKA